MDAEFGRAILAMQMLGSSPSLARGDLVSFEAELRGASALFGGAVVGIALQDGTAPMSTALPQGGRRFGARASALSLQAIASEQIEISNLMRGPVSGIYPVEVAAPSHTETPDGDRRLAHVTVIGLPRAQLPEIIRARSAGWDGSVLTVLDRDGTIVARSLRDEE